MLFTNIIHRFDDSETSLQALQWQWAEARELGLRTTTLLTYPTLFESKLLDQAEKWLGPGDELGLHLQNFKCSRILEKYGVREPMLWLWPREKRMAVIDEMVEAFTARFGYPPASIGSYVMDAWTLREIERRHPSIEIAINSCFEEGVKMYYGNNRNWLLFSDGGPWNPYFPSRGNALAPAKDSAEAINIIAVPHLNRDMILALSSRDDWFASHPGNIFRARINEGSECPYLFRFFDAWERQAELNGLSYLNVFVSTPWLQGTFCFIENEADVRALYSKTLRHFKAREEAGAVSNLTMHEFSKEFRARVAPGSAMVCHWCDELTQTKREVIWLCNAHHRTAFDMGRGGAIVDFRPYDGRLNLDLGPETQCLWNGNAPFLISSEHNGGHWNSSQHATISDGRHSACLCDRRLRTEVERLGPQRWLVRARPANFTLGGKSVVIQSEWELSEGEGIIIRRQLLDTELDAEALRLTEVFLGRAGTTEYPEDQRGIRLFAGESSLVLSYSGERIECPGADWVGAEIPRLAISLKMVALTETVSGSVADCVIFSPSFRLELNFPFQSPTATCLQTRPLVNH